jgi:hypothetical protein
VIDVRDSRELQAAVLGLKVIDRDLAKDIRRATVDTMSPVWRSRVDVLARTHQDRKVLLAGARIAGGNPPAALAGTSARRLKGGGRPQDLAARLEFGSNSRNAYRAYTGKSPRGKAYPVRRRTQRQLPPRFPRGRVAYPALAEMAPRMVSLWVQLVVRRVYQGLGD